jgi:serine/threonine-protein kinase|nr:serine/threonine-protein kinase [Kofleriaceae bacterium]
MSGPDDTLPDVDATGPSDRASVPNYQLGALLGSGGMGEVILARDLEIGRDVALKRMRGTLPTRDAIARFLREAKIQAVLDHPAIVPVHAMGRDADGRPYFTMKRLTGTTLQESLATRAHRPQRLLRAFVDICHAIEVAHERGVVHRDLKPANIMLGDRGEVYVLDWGVARVIGESADVSPSQPRADEPADATATGTLLGTPGYMAPEQVRGEPVVGASDVYALGAILFEMLAGEPLHPPGGAALATTLDPARSRSPAARRPDGSVPPELDAICRDALSDEPAARPTARQLADRVDAYLDGDRDHEQRRKLALEQLTAARADVATADASKRAAAIRAAGRAFMLDPESDDASALLTSLTMAMPDELPPVLARELGDVQHRAARLRSRPAFFAYLSFFLIIPLLPWLHVGDPLVFGAVVASIGAIVIAQFVNWKIRYVPTAVFLVLHFATCVMVSRFASPFVVMPTLIAAVMLAVSNLPWVVARTWFVVLWSAAAGLVPFALEWAGVFHDTWRIADGELVLQGDAVRLLQPAAMVVANIAIGVIVSYYALGLNRDRSRAQRRAYILAWQMRQLLPEQDGVRSPQHDQLQRRGLLGVTGVTGHGRDST